MQHLSTGTRKHSAASAQAVHVLLAPFGSKAAFLINPIGEVTHRGSTDHGLPHFCYLLPNEDLFANEVCADPKPETDDFFAGSAPDSELPEGMYGECLREVNEVGETV